MKKFISMVLALILVLSLATGVMAEVSPDGAKNNLCITGKVDYANDAKIALILEDEEGRTLYYSNFSVVQPDGSYELLCKYEVYDGDSNRADVFRNVKYSVDK